LPKDASLKGGFVNLLSWYQSTEKNGAALTIDGQEVSFAGLDVLAVIKSHLEWRRRLENYISGQGEILEITKVVADDVCVLGKWLHYGPQRFTLGLYPEYAELMEAHRRFHLYAGRVVTCYLVKGATAARERIQQEFDGYSREIVRLLHALMEREKGAA